jgi:hypothetical protein
MYYYVQTDFTIKNYLQIRVRLSQSYLEAHIDVTANWSAST